MRGFLGQLCEASNDGMAVVGRDGLRFVNGRLREILGLSRDDVRPQIGAHTWVQWFAEADRRRVEWGHDRRLGGEELRERYEAGLVHSSGRLVLVEVTMHPLTGPEGPGTVAVVRDTSRWKLHEAARLETEARFRTVYEHSAIGVALTDLTGRHIDANPALLTMLGLTLEEFRASRTEQFTHPDDRNPDLTLWHELERGERTHYRRETRFLHKTGYVVWASLVVSFTRDADGRPTGIVTMIEDITEHRRALAEVRTLSGLLPICAYCKQIRDDAGYWHQVESYIRDHSDAQFSHGICPSCLERLRPDAAGDS